jgi:hypothetical protein
MQQHEVQRVPVPQAVLHDSAHTHPLPTRCKHPLLFQQSVYATGWLATCHVPLPQVPAQATFCYRAIVSLLLGSQKANTCLFCWPGSCYSLRQPSSTHRLAVFHRNLEVPRPCISSSSSEIYDIESHSKRTKIDSHSRVNWTQLLQ